MPARSHDVPQRRTLAAIERAIVEAEIKLTLHLAHLERCRAAGRDTTLAEALVTAAQVRLVSLHQSRDEALRGRPGS